MAFQESNERIVPIENMLISADDRAEYHEWLDSRTPHQRDSQSRDEVAEAAPAKIIPVIVTVDELPPSDYPKPYNPQHVVDGVAVENVDDDPEDDGQPSEYDEWQDYMGGDEHYDHSENACW